MCGIGVFACLMRGSNCTMDDFDEVLQIQFIRDNEEREQKITEFEIKTGKTFPRAGRTKNQAKTGNC